MFLLLAEEGWAEPGRLKVELTDCEATFIYEGTKTNQGKRITLVIFVLSRMSHQIRPGARGGRDQFSWDQVKEDKQRSNYLGSSIHGLPDKFKKGPETFWYTKETNTISEKKSEKSEIALLKEKEKLAMDTLLGGNLKKNNSIIEQVNHVIKPSSRRENSSDRVERRDNRYRSYSKSTEHRDLEHTREDKYGRICRRDNNNREDEYDRGYKSNDRRRYDRSRSPKMYK